MTVPLYNLTDTWNNAGTVFTAIKMNVTNTASAAGSLLLDLQIDGVSQLKIDKAAILTTVSQSEAHFSYFVFDGLIDGNTAFGGARWTGRGGGSIGLLYETDGIGYGINHMLGWADQVRGDNAFAGSHIDVSLSRNAAGILQLNRNKALTSPTSFQVYNTTDAASGAPTNFERGGLDWTSSANIFRIRSESGGSGTTRIIAIDGFAKSGAAVAGDIPSGTWALVRDTSGATTKLIYNNAGTLMTVALT